MTLNQGEGSVGCLRELGHQLRGFRALWSQFTRAVAVVGLVCVGQRRLRGIGDGKMCSLEGIFAVLGHYLVLDYLNYLARAREDRESVLARARP